jgi:hypothetical protein
MCNWRSGNVLLTYPRRNRQEVESLLRQLGVRGFTEHAEMFSFLEQAHINIEVVAQNFDFTLSLITVPEGEEFRAAIEFGRLASPDLLLSIEPNLIFSVAALGPVTKFRFDSTMRTTYQTLVNVPAAHSAGFTGKGAKVAVLDTGIEGAGSSLNPGTNFFTLKGAAADDDQGHGTAIASIIDDVAPDADLIPIKIANSSGQTDLWLLEAGLFAANAAGANVTNISLEYGLMTQCPKCHTATLSSGKVRSFVLEHSIKVHRTTSCVLAATGNSGLKSIAYPAACPGVVAVASVNSSDSLSAFSNHDPTGTYHTAPGGEGLPRSTPSEYVGQDPTKKGVLHAGTSMAAAYASGVVALLFDRWNRSPLRTNFPDHIQRTIAGMRLIRW